MIQDQRVFHQTSDLSLSVNDFRTGAAPFTYVLGQYLYIGQILPFQNLYFELGTANVVAATATVEVWRATGWNPIVDLIDETVGLTTNGRIQWTVTKFSGWDYEDTELVTGLTAQRVYGMYWLRMSWSATLTAGTTIKYIGQKFSNDGIFYSFYPDLKNTQILDSFAPGQTTGTKTTWDEQHYMASEIIVRDLKKNNIIKARGQIIDYSIFSEASCHKVAEMVYQGLGKAYADQLKTARERYKEALQVTKYAVDLDGDTRISEVEREKSVKFGTR